MDGKSANQLARDLTKDQVPKWDGTFKWYESTVRKILSNEKYKGDALLQKTYTVDFLTKKRVENTGQIPQYYVEDSHPAIIDKEMWEAVQLEMERRRNYAKEHGLQKLEYATSDNPFAGKVICGSCGKVFGRKVWNSTDERLRRIIWRCNGKYPTKGEKGCESRHIDDGILYQVFVNTFNTLLENKNYFMAKWKERLRSDNTLHRYKAKQFMKIISETGPVLEFEIDFYNALVEKITVVDGKEIIVTLLDGTELECEIE
ncbi:hypothetical protein SCACP_07950 [Sporomusa carbonis]